MNMRYINDAFDINSRHTQLENLAFSANSSTVLFGLVTCWGFIKIFVGLVRNFVGLVDLNFTSHGASEM